MNYIGETMGIIPKLSELGSKLKIGLDSMAGTPRFEGPKSEKTNFGKNSARVSDI